jgi:adenylate kinase
MSISEHYQTVLLFGPPGVGKGTQGKILSHVPGFFHSSTGDIFRNLDVNSDMGKLFYQYSSRGELVPDDVTIKIWSTNIYANAVLGLFKPQRDILVLDGLPRSVAQARLLYRTCQVLKVIHLVCRNKDELFDRMRMRAVKQNRADDAQPEVIRRRFEVYERETAPVLAFYPKEIVHEVDAMGSPAAVMRDILDVLVPMQDDHFREGTPEG